MGGADHYTVGLMAEAQVEEEMMEEAEEEEEGSAAGDSVEEAGCME